jgi:hypothetical protein
MKSYFRCRVWNIRAARSISCSAILILSAQAFGIESSRVKALFKNPPVDYSTGPLWVWNDLLTEKEIRETLCDLAQQKVRQVWVHPRPGLMTPYLSNDWFRLWDVALQEARRLDMKVWIYDENSYPSGFAGGFVPEALPESRGRGLVFRQSRTAPSYAENIVGVYLQTGSQWTNVTAAVLANESLPEANYLVVREVRASNSPWHGNRSYVNLLSPGVTEKFLDITLEAYRRAVGKEFGRRIPGVFTDEPNIHPAGEWPWSEVLREEFQKRWGYDLLEHLPSLSLPTGDWRRIRHNYFQVLNEQFIRHWARPYHDYCETNHLEWTGHYWDHEWPRCLGVPDNMAMYAWHQRPAIDCLMNQYSENTHAQFGNVRMVKELSSVANQLGMQRTLCEVYGAGGWDLRFEDMKRIGDWLEVLGVNTLNQHLSYVTIRGARKRDHPQSFSYHEPWWGAYHVSAEYFARLSAALSQGEQTNPVLVIEPTTTAWMYQGDEAKLRELGDSFFLLLMKLEAAQIEYDIGCEDIITRHGHVEAGALKVGNRSYRRIVLSPCVENLNAETKALLEQVPRTLIGRIPDRINGTATRPGGATTSDSRPEDSTPWLEGVVANLARDAAQDGFLIDRTPEGSGILFHHRRQLADGQLLFLVNTSLEHRAAGNIRTGLKGVEVWDLYTGETKPYPHSCDNQSVHTSFDLPPSGSLLLFFSKRTTKPGAPNARVETLLPVSGPKVQRLEPNVLTLDYVDISAGGETRSNIYFYQANQIAWKSNGMPRDPWDSAVQFENELISKTFPAESGFEARYRFTIADEVPADLEIVLERPDLYSIACNGQPIKADLNRWWLDKAFGRLPIAKAAHTGENSITLKAAPFSMFHELEPAYVRGDFSLKAITNGFEIVRPNQLDVAAKSSISRSSTAGEITNSPTLGWSAQGYPFYSAGVKYSEEFSLVKSSGKYFVVLPTWRGSVALVEMNGHKVGYIDAPPWRCEVTRWSKKGENKVAVTVIGTLKNTLGPHHGSPGLGSAWPGSFQQAPESGPPPGAKYSTVAYGLFEPFVLQRVQTE